jgi:hypothetical protein
MWNADLDKLRRARVGYLPPKWRESLRDIVNTTEDKPPVDVHSAVVSRSRASAEHDIPFRVKG